MPIGAVFSSVSSNRLVWQRRPLSHQSYLIIICAAVPPSPPTLPKGDHCFVSVLVSVDSFHVLESVRGDVRYQWVWQLAFCLTLRVLDFTLLRKCFVCSEGKPETVLLFTEIFDGKIWAQYQTRRVWGQLMLGCCVYFYYFTPFCYKITLFSPIFC